MFSIMLLALVMAMFLSSISFRRKRNDIAYNAIFTTSS